MHKRIYLYVRLSLFLFIALPFRFLFFAFGFFIVFPPNRSRQHSCAFTMENCKRQSKRIGSWQQAAGSQQPAITRQRTDHEAAIETNHFDNWAAAVCAVKGACFGGWLVGGRADSDRVDRVAVGY
ncbi:unnamed protein product [Ceratitis capitata]|uniref:(Mediterranean fruit fly) hypothetical protein n=1 Tax=Ceratitis capitata TaxID=7213 RepID=A0A811V884_CERCA|nr:unnamed protein product [Ceratitis capitata]